MQFNTDLLQSLLISTPSSKTAADSTVSTEAASGEFLSLLTEAKELAKSGAITPNEFLESLSDESLELDPNQKKALAKSFMDFMPSEDLSTEQSVKVEETTIKNGPLGLKALLGTQAEVKSIEKPIQNTIEIKGQNFSNSNVEVEEVVDPKIANGKLISLKNINGSKPAQMPIQSAQDFVMQNQAMGKVVNAEQMSNARQSFFPNSKSAISAFGKEQETINKSVFAGKNPFINSQETSSVMGNVTDTESALFSAVESTEGAEYLGSKVLDFGATKATMGLNSATTSVATNVMDLSSINIQNTEQLIDKISEYITTSRLENQDSVELLVKHDSLGQFKVSASKGELPNQVNLEINAASDKAKAFFQDNEVEMIKSLSKSGVKLGEVKVALTSDSSFQSSSNKNDGSSNQNNNGFNSSKNPQFASSNHQESGRERRQELWNMYRERLGA
ncbi:hypothetical protein [Halobacteriovorax sp. HLS]|uniref:hypothetical protein n=1 Tax=Halobacteriovorax sp. HLS TaxID=2234000 RepID=UPI000FD89F72|nr:hypothetical protein [Halobacteriovorax sp. HLS]